jgi:hypothetical protein
MSGLTEPPTAAVAEFDVIIHQQVLGYKAQRTLLATDPAWCSILAENRHLFDDQLIRINHPKGFFVLACCSSDRPDFSAIISSEVQGGVA